MSRYLPVALGFAAIFIASIATSRTQRVGGRNNREYQAYCSDDMSDKLLSYRILLICGWDALPRLLLKRRNSYQIGNDMKRAAGKLGLFALFVGAVIILSAHNAKTTADGCAVVLKTPDGFVNIRKGPGIQYPSIAKVKPGDTLYADDRCYEADCAKNHNWLHVTGTPKHPLTLDGWVSLKFVEPRGDCPERSSSENQEAVVLIVKSFSELPAFVQQEVSKIRDRCMKEAEADSKSFWDEMQGIHTFYLPGDKSISILVDDRHVCNTQTKGGNCHTWGCDVRIYRHVEYLRRAGSEWVKIFDVPIANLFLSISTKNEFILAALSIVGKHDLCGKNYDIGHCNYLLSWKNDKWVWQRLR